MRPFSSSIPKTLKKHLRKGGYNYSNIVDNWSNIISKKISDSCYPLTVKMNKDMRDGTLVLNVVHGKEMEIEYQKNEIIDQINSFFGYNCIKNISLKIIQEKIIKKDKLLPKIKNLKKRSTIFFFRHIFFNCLLKGIANILNMDIISYS
mgnify:CR=1 FL=1